MPHILLLEDHDLSRVSLSQNLVREGFTVQAFALGGEALAHVRAALGGEAPLPQMAILDLSLPDMDGLDVLKALRAQEALKGLAVILLTDRSDVIDRVLGLELGADDYLPKPYSFRELLARIRAVSRRRCDPSPETSPTLLCRGPLIVDLERFTVRMNGVMLDLPRREFELLAYFLMHPGRVHTRRELLRDVWKLEAGTGERTVDVHVRRLRSKLGECGDLIATVVGVGYRLD